MRQWYASVNYGLENIIGDIIKNAGAQNIKILESALIFSCQNELSLKCINNLFAVISSFDSKSVTEAAKKISRLEFSPPRLNGKTFRLVVMDCGKLRAIPQSLMGEIEKNISRQTGLAPLRANPGIEIWLMRRNDGKTYFMVRTQKRPPHEKTLRRGELRPDIADVMLYMAKTNKQSVIVDMFGGWGAIAAAAAESERYKKIYTGDINGECVRLQRERLKGKRDCFAQKWDALSLPLEDASVDRIITDPPWGEFEKIDAPEFYDKFINEAARILRPDGILVFLSSADIDARQSLEKHGFLYSAAPLKINGKDTFLFCSRHTFSITHKGAP